MHCTETFLLHFMQENRESLEQFFAEYREAGKKSLKRTLMMRKIRKLWTRKETGKKKKSM